MIRSLSHLAIKKTHLILSSTHISIHYKYALAGSPTEGSANPANSQHFSINKGYSHSLISQLGRSRREGR